VIRRLLPEPTPRLRFREMNENDLDNLAALLGDDEVMSFYPAAKTRAESLEWIRRMQEGYTRDGHAMWIIETHAGEFVGDCGITWQSYNDTPVREVGYHVRRDLQRRGLASEAAQACVELVAREFAPTVLTAIIHPENVASRRVAEHLGMTHIDDDRAHPWIVRTVMGMTVDDPGQRAS